MSTTVYSIQNPSSIPTRRSQTRRDNTENDDRTANRRSLSGKFRNFFRKSSSSPNRAPINTAPPPTVEVRQRSISPEVRPSSTEAPHLRAPLVSWPFGKKKSKVPETTNASVNSKTKTKVSRKSKKKTGSSIEISSPIYDPQHQTSIQGVNFIPRTPEVVQMGTGRSNSISNYETKATKGFRDYTFMDQPRLSYQANISNVDGVTSPPYPVERSYTPSINHHDLPDTNIGYSYRRHVSPSPPISEMDVYPSPRQPYKIDGTPTGTQVIIEKIPLRAQVQNFSPTKQQRKIDSVSSVSHLADKSPINPQTSKYPSTITESPELNNHYNQWRNSSSSSLNQSDTRLTSSSMDIDVPKINAPTVPSHGHTVNTEVPYRVDYQPHAEEPYKSTLKMNNNYNYPNHTYANTNGPLPDAELIHGDPTNSIRSSKSSYAKYPGLSAIFQYHLNRPKTSYNEYPTTTTSPQRTKRFDASTTTLHGYEPEQEWSNTYKNPSPISPPLPAHHHDGYIRPLTPRKPSIDKNIHAVYLGTEDARTRSPSPQLRTPHFNSNERPVIYRSSTTIYTKDKHNYVDGGELRTFSLQSTDDNDFKKKSTTSLHIDINGDHEVPAPTITTEYQYYTNPSDKQIIRNDSDEQNYVVAYEYPQHHAYDTRPYPTVQTSPNFNDERNSNFARTSTTFDHEQPYDQETHSYMNVERRQEPLNVLSPVDNIDESLRNYSLKRSDSYDGLGILISADVKTGFHPRIRDIEPGSPGYRAGLRKNDRIIYINGINVENLEFSDVLALIQQGLNDNNLEFTVVNESTVF